LDALDVDKNPQEYTKVDLKLDKRLVPTPWKEFQTKNGHTVMSTAKLAESIVSGKKSYGIGSVETDNNNGDDQILFPAGGDLGLFGAVMDAWKNHYVLRTCPEDWWFPVACRIARAVDKAAQKEEGRNKDEQLVRNLFVNHQGQERISVDLPAFTIYDANYDDLFSEFSSELKDRINVPEYAKAMQSNFSTSGSTHTIASQINLMASLKQFFSFEMRCWGCGLAGLEMKGDIDDWKMLGEKLVSVREILKPLRLSLDLSESWWDCVGKVFRMLAATRAHPDHPVVAKSWLCILCDTTGTKYVGGGGSLPGRPVEVKAYDGWLIMFLLGQRKVLAEELNDIESSERKALSGYNTVPLKVSLTWCKPPISDDTDLVAGMVGYKVHHVKDDTTSVPSVEPHHMWALMADSSSPLLKK